MERRDVSLDQAVRNFCIRVLEGNGHPQEVAILPQMLQYVMGHDPEVESRQNELAAKGQLGFVSISDRAFFTALRIAEFCKSNTFFTLNQLYSFANAAGYNS